MEVSEVVRTKEYPPKPGDTDGRSYTYVEFKSRAIYVKPKAFADAKTGTDPVTGKVYPLEPFYKDPDSHVHCPLGTGYAFLHSHAKGGEPHEGKG